MKPCRKLRPPTGPISPAHEPPAMGSGPSSSSIRAASWSGTPKSRLPRPLQVNSRAPAPDRLPAGEAARRSARRSSSAAAASRTWNCTVCPTCSWSPTASAPVSRSAPIRLRTRKSPREKSARCSSTTTPRWRPAWRSARSSSLAASDSSRSRSSAGRPASSWTKLPSARVTTSGCPTGRQPWDTTVSTPIPSRKTPTAPWATIRASSTSRFAPGRVAADARPPTTVSPGRSSAHRRRNASTGNVKGSANSNRVSGLPSSSGQPTTDAPSGVSSTWSAVAVRRASGSRAANTERAGPLSTSRPSPTTASVDIASNTRGSSRFWIACTMSSSAPRKCGETKHTRRSASSAPSCSRISPAVSPTAWAGTGCRDDADAYRFTRS